MSIGAAPAPFAARGIAHRPQPGPRASIGQRARRAPVAVDGIERAYRLAGEPVLSPSCDLLRDVDDGSCGADCFRNHRASG